MKKLLAVLLSLLLLLAVLPLSSYADAGISRNDAVNWARNQENRSASQCDIDGNGLWCTDLATAYINFCYLRHTGDNSDPWTLHNPYTTRMAYAYDDYLDGNPNWTIIARTSSTVPQPGDLFVSETDSAGYGYGHVGIVLTPYGSSSAEIIEMSGDVKPTVTTITWGSTASYYAEHLIRFNFFIQDTFSVTYNANGGKNPPGTQTKTKGQALTLSSTKPTRDSGSAGSYTVTLDPNGGKVDTTALSASRTKNYTFQNWNTKSDGTGTSYAPGGSYTADESVTLYAQWKSGTKTSSVSLPTPYYYGYFFKGWATSASASSGVTGSYTPTGNVTLYATWEKENLSGWRDEKPDNIYEDQIETATEYCYSDRTANDSREQTDSGTIDFVKSWPSGFNTSDSLYSQYNHKPKTAGVSGTKEIVESTVANGYLYWHWCFNKGALSSGNYNVYISDIPYETDSAGRYFQYFTAFKSDVDAGHIDPNGRNGGDCFYLWRDDPADGSWWWFRIPVYRQTYKEYTGATTYGEWSDWSVWTMQTYPTGETRKMQSKTVYRYKDSVQPFNVTLNANGGTCSVESKSVVRGEMYGALPTPTRAGYTFDGWYTAASGGSQAISTSRVTSSSAHTLYAHWKQNATPTPKPTTAPTAKPTAKPTHKPTDTEIDAKIVFDSDAVEYKGTTPYVIWNYDKHEPSFEVYDADGALIDPQYYTYKFKENKRPGTGYVFVTFTNGYTGSCRAFFKIYLPATAETTVENVENGIQITWEPVEDAAGYVIYRRAWNLVDAGWTTFERWNNTTATEWVDETVYAGTRYQYGVKAYFERRYDPIAETEIGGNVGDNYNLGIVGPLKTTVRITTRKLTSVKAGTKKMTVKWEASKVFTGYQIQYALNSAFSKDVKTVKITDAATYSKVIKKLKTGKKYYVRVRSYHEFEGMTYYGQWSNVKNCKVR